MTEKNERKNPVSVVAVVLTLVAAMIAALSPIVSLVGLKNNTPTTPWIMSIVIIGALSVLMDVFTYLEDKSFSGLRSQNGVLFFGSIFIFHALVIPAVYCGLLR